MRGAAGGEEALWLAERGWSVQAVDIAAAPLAAARERAAALGADVADRITWRQADLSAHPPAAEAFDLVCSHYVHTAHGPAALLEALASAVAPGGTLLVAAHHPDDAHHADTPGAHVSPQQAAAVLDPGRWEVLAAETATRTVDAGGHGQGHGHGHSHPMVGGSPVSVDTR
ncbi:methyltransferase domain-containing protein [Streptomonospora salina]|uniref:2-polyprenyl-3-methyl-5-hydroxy-6-metoxy-1, 4-benzoquinol methylase n=1 Tax=Streptomonospora salina TaxID=104205 RepID=A0A841EHT5_9ACTN|nr:class I SAM-dependent methyltransferase [Streptomonospora salina]MBB6000939.1 2-polyprenyl-3-methyl-5-hydroxy-6-metoxy-1,4-benzoquinol methylase [Streptomonospora salina]